MDKKMRIGKISIEEHMYKNVRMREHLYALFSNIIPWRIEESPFSLSRIIYAESAAFDEVDRTSVVPEYIVNFKYNDETDSMYVEFERK